MLAQIAILFTITALAAGLGYLLLAKLPPRLDRRPGVLRLIEWTCRLALAAVFLAAAFGKLRDPYGFAVNLFAYRLLPAAWAAPAALVLPAIESVAALALITGLLWRGAALICGTLMLVFIAALAQAILRGIDIDCGCFGEGSSPVSFWLIARNYLLLLCALLPLAIALRRRTEVAIPERRPTPLSGPAA
jgi:putative oxidoreductase